MSSITPNRPPILPLYDIIMAEKHDHPDEIIRSIINEITNKDKKEPKSTVLSAEISPYGNSEYTADITDLIHKVEGYLKDFNSDCVYVRDLYHYLKDSDIIIDEKNEKLMKIKIIDSFADEHVFSYDNKLSL